ncbi:MAG TPA: hypothetical protein VH913_17300 [Hyphomicrobiaceae bacterium]
MHKVADKLPAADAGTQNPLGRLVLVRIAGATRPVDKGEIAADLSIFAGAQMPASRWRASVEGALDALSDDGLITPKPGGFAATAAGAAAAARFLDVSASTPLTWERACNEWLIAKAVGQRKTTTKRLAALATLDGLRAAILVHGYGLQIKGAVTPARLRQALAAVALRKAFGGQTAAAVAGKSGLPARASRLLAAQLMDKPRDPGTDRRLVSALAAQACGARGADLPALRAGVLRRSFAVPPPPSAMAASAGSGHGTRPDVPSPFVREGQGGGDSRTSRVGGPPTHSPSQQGRGEFGHVWGEPGQSTSNAAQISARPAKAVVIESPPVERPRDLPGFAREVRRLAAGEAQGWSGDRKAYISRVWRTLREQRPEWGLSEIQFKCMLAEAHRAGQLALANADLKDETNIRDVQDSAVIYRNAVFHFIRVDA